METSKKVWIGAVASLVLVTGLLVRFGAIASGDGASGVNVSMPVAKSLQIFLGRGESVNLGSDEEGTMRLGSSADVTTNLTALSLTEDLTVGDDLTVAGDTTLTGTTTFNGAVAGSVPTRTVVTMTTATTTPCAVQNTSGSDKTLIAASVNETAYVGAGTVGLTVGTSTTAFVTSTSPLISNLAFANSASQNVISTTSTLMSAYANWKNGEWMVFKTVTSTNAGTCTILSM